MQRAKQIERERRRRKKAKKKQKSKEGREAVAEDGSEDGDTSTPTYSSSQALLSSLRGLALHKDTVDWR